VAQEDRVRVSRRMALRAAMALAVAGAAGVAEAQQPEQPVQKVDPKLVMYQPTPKNGQACNKCVNFEPPNACKLVAGVISPAGWCQLFAPKPT
jgi:hypothetical protein